MSSSSPSPETGGDQPTSLSRQALEGLRLASSDPALLAQVVELINNNRADLKRREDRQFGLELFGMIVATLVVVGMMGAGIVFLAVGDTVAQQIGGVMLSGIDVGALAYVFVRRDKKPE